MHDAMLIPYGCESLSVRVLISSCNAAVRAGFSEHWRKWRWFSCCSMQHGQMAIAGSLIVAIRSWRVPSDVCHV